MGSTGSTPHIIFVDGGASDSGKTRRVVVRNVHTGELIGKIGWATNFRKYAYYPAEGTFYDSSCLRTVAEYCDNLTDTHRRQAEAS